MKAAAQKTDVQMISKYREALENYSKNPNLKGSQVWKQKDLTEISFYACKLQCVPTKLITTWRSTLEILQLHTNAIRELPDIDAESMPSLKALTLSNNRLQRLPCEFLMKCRGLEMLNLENNQIQEASHHLIHSHRNISELNLSQNQLTSFVGQEECEDYAGTLSRIDLANNNITSISFSNCSTTKEEDTELNSHIPQIILPHSAFSSLKVINCKGNRIDSLTPFLPLLLHGQLEVLLFSCNRVREIPTEFTTDSMKHLRWLDLSYNRLTSNSIPAGSFGKMPQLDHLFLNGNDLSEEVTSSLSSLKIEYLSLKDEDNVAPSAVIEGKLFLGSLQSAQSFFLLKQLAITHVLSVLRTSKPFYPEDFQYMTIDAEDTASYDISKCFEMSHKFIDSGLKGGGAVLVHCAQGISRSASVVISYIMKKRKIAFEDALRYVVEKRPIVCPNSGFRSQLKRYENRLNDCSIS
ncbi:hypothetical protein PROFUN_03010 [Planoprotostelium fungivorum]|uniref:protein-tyrosine-phosphatase n=1 Tax=Planoprotostelium fungivorum TaxID=1890364 RepID=A0A2P6NXC8_9EUKA|nr:hypothetical protein PROFUN_03010 [Planoprotostelium fungivorum]